MSNKLNQKWTNRIENSEMVNPIINYQSFANIGLPINSIGKIKTKITDSEKCHKYNENRMIQLRSIISHGKDFEFFLPHWAFISIILSKMMPKMMVMRVINWVIIRVIVRSIVVIK
jgi:hypothetical protein